jgi:hypothetical protein
MLGRIEKQELDYIVRECNIAQMDGLYSRMFSPISNFVVIQLRKLGYNVNVTKRGYEVSW